LQAKFSRRENQLKRRGKDKETIIISTCAKARVSAEESTGGRSCKRFCWGSKLQKNLLEVEIAKVVEELLEGKFIKKERFGLVLEGLGQGS